MLFSRLGRGAPARLALEFAAIFIGGPLAILLLHRHFALLPILWLGALLAHAGMRGRPRRETPAPRRELRAILLRFLLLAPGLTLATWLAFPRLFLRLPLEHPLLWALIMLLYPLLSVWPQEMLYRGLLFHRFSRLFGSERGLVVASASAFGFAHIIFLNAIAVALTTAGGLLLAQTYARHRSLFWSALEHSLYGCLFFSIGLGRFFYTGTAWHG